MSHSTKKTPICGNSKAESKKLDKCFANRNLRREARESINTALNGDDLYGLVVLCLREASCNWSFAKDGKQFLHDREKFIEELRK